MDGPMMVKDILLKAEIRSSEHDPPEEPTASWPWDPLDADRSWSWPERFNAGGAVGAGESSWPQDAPSS